MSIVAKRLRLRFWVLAPPFAKGPVIEIPEGPLVVVFRPMLPRRWLGALLLHLFQRCPCAAAPRAPRAARRGALALRGGGRLGVALVLGHLADAAVANLEAAQGVGLQQEVAELRLAGDAELRPVARHGGRHVAERRPAALHGDAEVLVAAEQDEGDPPLDLLAVPAAPVARGAAGRPRPAVALLLLLLLLPGFLVVPLPRPAPAVLLPGAALLPRAVALPGCAALLRLLPARGLAAQLPLEFLADLARGLRRRGGAEGLVPAERLAALAHDLSLASGRGGPEPVRVLQQGLLAVPLGGRLLARLDHELLGPDPGAHPAGRGPSAGHELVAQAPGGVVLELADDGAGGEARARLRRGRVLPGAHDEPPLGAAADDLPDGAVHCQDVRRHHRAGWFAERGGGGMLRGGRAR
mmetsp:Transcript_57219/g.161569  ORF Transcript_57219/g.161569 Transcript_57219/m.161569 type:complete len:410 (-) Transcript_57219:7-1236(-)